jgi:hypothetical protein
VQFLKEIFGENPRVFVLLLFYRKKIEMARKKMKEVYVCRFIADTGSG